MRQAGLRILLTLLTVLLVKPAGAIELPKWELGIGMAALRLPAYRGARAVNNYVLPFPYITFRGERLRIDEEGIHSILLQGERLRLDFSLAGNVPVKDGDVPARLGMPGLDPLGEIGPSLEWSLWRDSVRPGESDLALWLKLPARAVFSVGDPLVAHQGWVFSPSLDLVYRHGEARYLQRWALSYGPLYANKEYHDYFYTVAPAYATAGRSAYTAQGGYSGERVTLSVTLNRGDWFLAGFARYDDLDGAVFMESPLVETSRYFAFGLAVSRVFASSKKYVDD